LEKIKQEKGRIMIISKRYFILLFVCFAFVLPSFAQEILEVAKNGDLEKLKTLVEKDNELLKIKDGAGRTALHFAANSGHLDLVKYLLAKGVDINLKSNANTTPLHFAAFSGHLDIVKWLVENHAELEIKNNQMATPLYFAAMKGHSDVLKYLVENGAVVDALDREEGTPLHAAAQSGHLEAVKLLIQSSAEKKKKDTNGRTVIHFACQNGNKKIVNFLIISGLKIDDPDFYGKTPLYYAAFGGYKDAVDLLSPSGLININFAASDENTYLHAAVVGGLIEFAEKLISKEANVNIKNIYGITPYMSAIKHEKTEIAELLGRHGTIKNIEPHPVLQGDYLGQKKPGMVPELFMPGVISTDDLNERDVTFSRDGNEFYYSCWGGKQPFNIMFMKRENNQWTLPKQAPFSSQYQDAEAYFTPDEQKIFFISNRPPKGKGAAGSWQIWYVNRNDSGWSTPTLLGSPFEDGFYTTFTKTWKMYYTKKGDIFYSDYKNGDFSKPEKLDKNISSKEEEYNSFVSPNDDYIIFTSSHPNDCYGEGDLYICFHKKDGSWTQAINMGPKINSFARDYCPSVTPNGKYFFFCSRKYGTEDIFWVDAKVIEELKPDHLK
jgi:ankyrin repeat protein